MSQSERITILEANYDNLMEKLEEFQTNNKESHEAILASIEKIENKLNEAIEKKAGKWVEKVIWWTISIVFSGVIGYIGTIVVKLSKIYGAF